MKKGALARMDSQPLRGMNSGAKRGETRVSYLRKERVKAAGVAKGPNRGEKHSNEMSGGARRSGEGNERDTL